MVPPVKFAGGGFVCAIAERGAMIVVRMKSPVIVFNVRRFILWKYDKRFGVCSEVDTVRVF